MKKALTVILAALALAGCCDKSEKTIHSDFEARKAGLDADFSIFDSKMSGEAREAMEFLYAYMPLPDIADYSGEFYLANVESSLATREEMPWGKSIPDVVFRHFVLPVRVNNENMDESRMVFHDELRDRVKQLGMAEAALEVNHWCHEKVVYTPSDSRTSSPLASVKTAYGRCGEESTFTVAALRSVGIPARQVYTPRWAHTDDNHAWVEAWVDGAWHFMGACEPEAVLDLGWFNSPASRGMLMHTKVFGRYDGPEEIMSTNPCYTEINVTANYAPVSEIKVQALDASGNPCRAEVQFRLYNYAEFYPVAVRQTGDDGIASIKAGHGDLLVWAKSGDSFGFARCSVGKDSMISVRMDRNAASEGNFEFDMVPPAESASLPEVSPELAARNAERLESEDSIRNAYVAGFISEKESAEVARALGLDSDAVVKILRDSRGNYRTIKDFLYESSDRSRALRILQLISDKDRRDVSMEVLKDNHDNCPPVEGSFQEQYILNPRISNELLTPYRAYFKQAIPATQAEAFRADPRSFADWVRDSIAIDDSWNPQSLCMHPESVWKLRRTDSHSRDIFFVAAARSMGIAARIDEVTGKVQHADSRQRWTDVDFAGTETAENAPVGLLELTYEPNAILDDPKYYSHFTISKIAGGAPMLLNYPEDGSWSGLFKNAAELDAGSYMLTTGTRMADGSVRSRISFFKVAEGCKTVVPLVMRKADGELQVLGSFNSENLYHDSASGIDKSFLATCGRGYFVVGIIAPGEEPTNHAMRDIAACAKDLEAWGRSMVILFRDSASESRFDISEFPGLPSNIVFGTDLDGASEKEIREGMKCGKAMPLFIISDTFNRIVYISEGYTIGLGEQLRSVIGKL